MIRSGWPVQMICSGASGRDGRISQHPVYRIDRFSSVVFTEALPAVCRPEAAIYFPMGGGGAVAAVHFGRCAAVCFCGKVRAVLFRHSKKPVA